MDIMMQPAKGVPDLMDGIESLSHKGQTRAACSHYHSLFLKSNVIFNGSQHYK